MGPPKPLAAVSGQVRPVRDVGRPRLYLAAKPVKSALAERPGGSGGRGTGHAGLGPWELQRRRVDDVVVAADLVRVTADDGREASAKA